MQVTQNMLYSIKATFGTLDQQSRQDIYTQRHYLPSDIISYATVWFWIKIRFKNRTHVFDTLKNKTYIS